MNFRSKEVCWLLFFIDNGQTDLMKSEYAKHILRLSAKSMTQWREKISDVILKVYVEETSCKIDFESVGNGVKFS